MSNPEEELVEEVNQEEEEEEQEIISIKKEKKNYRNQRYRSDWESQDWARGWLSRSRLDASKAFCKWCLKQLSPKKSELMKHTQTLKHHENGEHFKRQRQKEKDDRRDTSAIWTAEERTYLLAPELCQRDISFLTNYSFETLTVSSPENYVMVVELNRPDKRNAMNTTFWKEMVTCFNQLSVEPNCRVVVLAAHGKMFTAGLDLYENEVFEKVVEEGDVGRKAFYIANVVPRLQESFNAIEKCPKPVIAAIHGGCIGGGIDMVSACDIRYCTHDAWFQIKEIDLGLAADLGTLQRFPKIIGNDSLFRELTYTTRQFLADEAKSMGFISKIMVDRDQMMIVCLETAKMIACKSPIGVQGSKISIVYSRDHSVHDGLEQVKNWNSAMLQSEDVKLAAEAFMENRNPTFSKL